MNHLTESKVRFRIARHRKTRTYFFSHTRTPRLFLLDFIKLGIVVPKAIGSCIRQLWNELYAGIYCSPHVIVGNLYAKFVRDDIAELFFTDQVRKSGNPTPEG